MKVSSGEYVLLDIMLCAVGCLLMVLLASMVQDRAPGIHSKPLTIVCSAVGSRQAFDVVEWQIRRPDGELVRHKPEQGTVLTPAAGSTRTAENQLFLETHALEGEWVVYVMLRGGGEPKAHYQKFGRSLRLPSMKRNDDEQLHGLYLNGLQQQRGGSNDDVDRLLSEIDDCAKRIINSKGLNDNIRIDRELDAFVSYRSLVRKVHLIKKHAGQSDLRVGVIETEIEQLIESTKALSETDDELIPITSAILMEERLRDEVPAHMPIWAVDQMRSWLNDSQGFTSANGKYRRNLVIGLRLLIEYVEESVLVDEEITNAIEDAAEYGEDIFTALLVSELQESLNTDSSIVLSAFVRWGDDSWPQNNSLQNGNARMTVQSNGVSVPIAILYVNSQSGVRVEWQTPRR